jgi:hypothetical protein
MLRTHVNIKSRPCNLLPVALLAPAENREAMANWYPQALEQCYRATGPFRVTPHNDGQGQGQALHGNVTRPVLQVTWDPNCRETKSPTRAKMAHMNPANVRTSN